MMKIIKYFLQPFSALWKNHCYYRTKHYLRRKLWYSAFCSWKVWGRSIIRRAPGPLAPKAYFVEFYGLAEGFWLLAFSEIFRTPLLSYSHFQGVKLKLNIRALFWSIVCFSTSIDSFQILNSKIFWIRLLHPVVDRSKKILLTTSLEVIQIRKKALEPPLKQTKQTNSIRSRSREFGIYKKQGDSTDNVYGSKSEKKESSRTSVEANKQTVSVKIYNFYWGTLHSIVERSKEILPTTSMEVSQRRKKALEPPLKQWLCVQQQLCFSSSSDDRRRRRRRGGRPNIQATAHTDTTTYTNRRQKRENSASRRLLLDSNANAGGAAAAAVVPPL